MSQELHGKDYKSPVQFLNCCLLEVINYNLFMIIYKGNALLSLGIQTAFYVKTRT
jgi:hypothetical protein